MCIPLGYKKLDFAVMFTTFIKMETFFMNTKNSKTNDSHRFKYDLIDKLDLKNPNKKHETVGETEPILIYANTINNAIVFKMKTGYKLELVSKETMKLLGSTKDTMDADKNSENVPRLENVEVVLVHCNLVNNSYQQHSRVLFTFVPNKQYGKLISISPHSLVFLKTMNTEFSEIEIWFTDQNNNALEIEDNVNISLIINTS